MRDGTGFGYGMMRKCRALAVALCAVVFGLLVCASGSALAAEDGAPQEGKKEQQAKPAAQGQPPAPVVVAKARQGRVAPRGEFVGSVRFPEVSTVATEVAGQVRRVRFEAGDRVKAGAVLAVLSDELVRQEHASARASLEQVRTQLENADRELARMEELFQAKTVSESSYDEARYTALGLRSEARSLEATVERLDILIRKTVIRSPFDGVVLERHADHGEWLGAGGAVATVARDDVMDVVVDVPQRVLPFTATGMDVPVRVGGQRIQGTVEALIPSGDVATRTFPIKIRIPGRASERGEGLAQGMEALCSLPENVPTEAVLVPRDAIATSFGKNVVWAALDGKAVPFPVEVIAYQGDDAAVRPAGPDKGPAPGMDVVIKGNERLRPGQPVQP